MKSPDRAPEPRESGAAAPQVSGAVAAMTILGTGLGGAISVADPTILSTNIAAVRTGLDLSRGAGSFVASLATLVLTATVLGAGVLGDLYGKKRMYVYGLLGTIAFGLLSAASPNGVVLMVARAGVGIASAFLLGLSLAIVNEVFSPERREHAISLFLAVSFVITAPLPAISTWIVQHVSWRACFLVTPVIALIGVVVTVRYVPETPRAARRLDLVGLHLAAAALLGVVYGLSRLDHGFNSGAIVFILLGLVAGAGFVLRELHTPYPALDLRIFRSGPFNVAVFAGITRNFVTSGSTILFAFYLVTVRNESSEILGLLLIPAMVLQAVAATGAGRAGIRLGDRTVLITGLVVLLAGLLALTLLDEQTSRLALFLLIALNSIASGLIQTPQSAIMMASVPDELGGTVSAVRAALSGAGAALGPALFVAVGSGLFVQERNRKLADLKITLERGREAFSVAHGGSEVTAHGTPPLDPELAREVVQGAEQVMLYTIHALCLIMAVVPVAAIVVALVLLPRRPAHDQQ